MELPAGLKMGQKLNVVKEDGKVFPCAVTGGGIRTNPATKVVEEFAFVTYEDAGVTFTDSVLLDKLSQDQ